MDNGQNKNALITVLLNIKGDKVIWMIFMCLVGISILVMSSSTSMLALQKHTTRLDLMFSQACLAAGGVGVAWGIYQFFRPSFFKLIARFSFWISLILLIFLLSHANLGFIKATEINNSKRIIYIMGLQMNVLDACKFFMILYTAWMIPKVNDGSLKWGAKILEYLKNKLSKKHYLLKFLTKKRIDRIIYLDIPLFIVGVCIIGGSFFTACFILGVCGFLMFIGGALEPQDILFPLLLVGGVLITALLIFTLSKGEHASHFGSALNRFDMQYEQKLSQAIGTENFDAVLDKIRQPISANIAIKEGGLLGKGPGNSTQKYIVPIIYEDFMFAFIVEEYGLWLPIILFVLYGAIIARGSIIVRGLTSDFQKLIVAGMVLLICGQAMLHILINTRLCPLSGQTLPLLSHGSFAFLMFCAAFGIILLFSKENKQQAEKNINNTVSKDNIKDSLDELDKI